MQPLRIRGSRFLAEQEHGRMRIRRPISFVVLCCGVGALFSCQVPELEDPLASRVAIEPTVPARSAANTAPAEAAVGADVRSSNAEIANPRMATLARLIRASDNIVIATLRSIDNRAVAADGLRSTLVYEVNESLKGELRPGARIRLRFQAGYNRDGTLAQITDVMEVISGRPGAVRVGERFLIFASRDAYEQRVRYEDEVPLPEVSQALEVLRIQGGEAQGYGMNPLFLRLDEVRSMLEANRDK
jgi:hypothetical protein